MAESIFAYFIGAAAMWYGIVRFIIAAAEEEEAKHRAGELAWQNERRAY